jgi:hypothetical protein
VGGGGNGKIDKPHDVTTRLENFWRSGFCDNVNRYKEIRHSVRKFIEAVAERRNEKD